MPDPHLTPVPRAGVRFEELDGEAVVYDRSGRQAIYLNETATVVWQLCDGHRSVADISALLTAEFPDVATELTTDISDAVDRMVAARVMTLTTAGEAASDTAQPD
jgi:hypothetical protein